MPLVATGLVADARDMNDEPTRPGPHTMNGRAVSGRWFEELPVGLEVQHAITRTVTETDNVWFTALTMNPAPLHLDEEFAAQTEFGQRIVNSLFTLGLLIGITVHELTMGTTVANLGFGTIEFPAPLFHGDTLSARSRVVSARASASRPTQGVVAFDHIGSNQHGIVVVRCERSALMHRRSAPGAG